jgi:hypothetical protein
MEKEPLKENEIWCAYCGPGWKAAWELVTDEGEVLVCNDHRFVLKQLDVVGLEREIGQEKWNEVQDIEKLEENRLEDIGDWKDLIDDNDL